MTPVNRKAGTGERTRELPGETPGIFIVLSGFATTDLSVRFRDACQGAEPMEKRLRRSLIVSVKSSWHPPGNFRLACKPVPLAAAERPSAASQ
jgi:hypothetical protein